MKRIILLIAVSVAPAVASADCTGPVFHVTPVAAQATTVPDPVYYAAVTTSNWYSEITICNSNENASSNAVKCRNDNVQPVMGASSTALQYGGDVLLKGDCVNYKSGRAVSCTSGSTVAVTSYECNPK